MTIQVNVHEAKTNLSKLLQAVERGEKVTIARGNVPVAELTKIEAKPIKRQLGTYRGVLSVPDDFDTMMQDEIEEMFHGGPIEPTK